MTTARLWWFRQAAFKAAAPTPSPSPIPHVPAVAPTAVSEDVQKQMTLQLASVTGMNAQWALK